MNSISIENNDNFYDNIIEQNITPLSSTMETILQQLVMTNVTTTVTTSIDSTILNNIVNYTNNINHYLNVTHCNEREKPELQLVTKVIPILVPLFFSIIAITGFFGNSLVILVVLLNTHMHSTTNLLIVNLACADLLFVIICIPFTAVDYLAYIWPFGVTWCRTVQYLIVVTMLASIYTLVLMSIDRFLAIVYPVRSRGIRTEFLTKIAIVILWITVLIVSAPTFMLYNLWSYECDNIKWLSCSYDYNSMVDQAVYQITFFTISYFFPLVLISILYIKIVSRLWHRIGGTMSAESQKGRRRVTRVVVVVVLAFASLWFPVQIILILRSLGLFETNAVNIILQVGTQTLAYTSSCINPILYAFFSENFRKAFRKAIYFSSSYRFGPSKQYNDLSTTTTAAGLSGRRRISAVQDSMSMAVI
ncbi:allatostatin-A receptor [Condylostylus longicornis]|uniref:allatostatin-A receptor n=1 Tax=Condylostylus longicornis TaxID=2530218 RepID=UPI00244E0EB9|nr:allatostatin-A receptor [Condylostylus longicornis]